MIKGVLRGDAAIRKCCEGLVAHHNLVVASQGLITNLEASRSGGPQGFAAVLARGNQPRGTEARARTSGKNMSRGAAAEGKELEVSSWRLEPLELTTKSRRKIGLTLKASIANWTRTAVT